MFSWWFFYWPETVDPSNGFSPLSCFFSELVNSSSDWSSPRPPRLREGFDGTFLRNIGDTFLIWIGLLSLGDFDGITKLLTIASCGDSLDSWAGAYFWLSWHSSRRSDSIRFEGGALNSPPVTFFKIGLPFRGVMDSTCLGVCTSCIVSISTFVLRESSDTTI